MHAPPVAAQAPVGAEHAVAGHDDGDVVAGAGGAGGLGAERVGGRVGQAGQRAELAVADRLAGRDRPEGPPGGLPGRVARLVHLDAVQGVGLAGQVGAHPAGQGVGVGGRPGPGRPAPPVQPPLQGLGVAGEPGRADPAPVDQQHERAHRGGNGRGVQVHGRRLRRVRLSFTDGTPAATGAFQGAVGSARTWRCSREGTDRPSQGPSRVVGPLTSGRCRRATVAALSQRTTTTRGFGT